MSSDPQVEQQMLNSLLAHARLSAKNARSAATVSLGCDSWNE